MTGFPPPPPPPPPPQKLSQGLPKVIQFLRKPWVIVTGVLLFILLITFFSINDIMKTILHSRLEVLVPNIEGKSLLDSLSVVSGKNLSLFRMDKSLTKVCRREPSCANIPC